MSKPVEKQVDPSTQFVEMIGVAMNVVNIRLQVAPESFDRVGLGDVWRETNDLDWEVPRFPAFAGTCPRFGRPTRRMVCRPGGYLLLQCQQHVRMSVDRPVVLNHVDPFGIQISSSEVAVKVDPTIQETDGTDDPSRGTRSIAPFGEQFKVTLLFPRVREGPLTIEDELVKVNENQVPPESAYAGLKIGHVG